MVAFLINNLGPLGILLLSTGSAVAGPANSTSAPSLSTTTAVTAHFTAAAMFSFSATATSSFTTPIIDGRCEWSFDQAKHVCRRKGFECINQVCVDMRTPEQKEADKQVTANGKDGRCLFTFETGKYTCTQQDFVCQEEHFCVDNRTPEQKAEDDKLQAIRDEQKRRDDLEKAKTGKLAGGIVEGLICAAIILGVVICCCKAKPKTRVPDPETLARAVEVEVQKVRDSLLERPPPRYVSR